MPAAGNPVDQRGQLLIKDGQDERINCGTSQDRAQQMQIRFTDKRRPLVDFGELCGRGWIGAGLVWILTHVLHVWD